MTKYKQAQEAICAAADFKMVMGAYKGNIESNDYASLVKMAHGELDELTEAIESNDYEKIIVESADCMNMLIGIAHKALNGYATRKK